MDDHHKSKGKKENCTGFCPIAINTLKEQSYNEGYRDGYNKAVDRMITIIGVVIALVGVVLRVLFRERSPTKTNIPRGMIGLG